MRCVRGSTLPNGLQMRQVRVPLGVVGMIYEARPNVTVDAAGPGAQERERGHPARRFRGGGRTNAALVEVLREALAARRVCPRRRPARSTAAAVKSAGR